MAVLLTGQTFTSGDQVTADKLMDIANDARFITTANETADGSTIQVDAVGGYLKVPSNGIGSNELSSDASVDANRAVGTNHIKDGAVTAAKLDSAAVSVLMPTATVLPYAGSTAPTGYLVCGGQSVLVADYGDLHGVIGYTYGGSGSSFNLPDLRGRVIAGLDNMGGSPAGRLTGLTNLGNFTGSATGLHNHTVTTSTVSVRAPGGGDPTRSPLATVSVDSNTIDIVQPTMTLNYIIKT